MTALTRALVLTIALATLSMGACKKDGAPARGNDGGTASARLRIAVVPKGTTHEFWKSVHAGAVKASRELDVDIVWKGPLKEDDLKEQIDVVQSFVAQGVSGIVLAPLSDKGLVGSVKAAKDAKIPVVIFDSDLQGSDWVSFVATDNYEAGKLAGDALAGERKDSASAKLAMLRYQEGSASTSNRERGFLDAVRARTGITVVSDNQYGGATVESALKASENLLAAQKADSGGLKGVFAPNESTTFGMLLALRKAKLEGKIRFVGFDSSHKLLDGVRQGHVDALVVQNPFYIGYLAVKTMVRHLRGETVDKRIDTGAKVVTKENLDTPEIKELVAPDLRKWLGE
jgi:ribose transport system substrate-binding protein